MKSINLLLMSNPKKKKSQKISIQNVLANEVEESIINDNFELAKKRYSFYLDYIKKKTDGIDLETYKEISNRYNVYLKLKEEEEYNWWLNWNV